MKWQKFYENRPNKLLSKLGWLWVWDGKKVQQAILMDGGWWLDPYDRDVFRVTHYMKPEKPKPPEV